MGLKTLQQEIVPEPVDDFDAENKFFAGVFFVGMAGLDFLGPPKSAPDLVWLRSTINQTLGDYGCAGLLALIGMGLWMWSAHQFQENRKEERRRQAEADRLNAERPRRYR